MIDNIDLIREIALEIIKIESEYFIKKEEDNSEFIPRIEYITESIGKYLLSKGIADNKRHKLEKDMIEKAKNIFIDIWLDSAKIDDEIEYNENIERRKAIIAFNQNITKKKYKTG